MGDSLSTPGARPASGPERRRHQRVKVSLAGRYMLADQREFPCKTEDMSPGGVSLDAPESGDVFSHVVIYLDEIGRLEGQIARRTEIGFAVRLLNSAAKRERLAEQLIWLANRKLLVAPEDRRYDRLVPARNLILLHLPNGSEYPGTIVDVSRSGVAVQTDISPPIGTPIVVGHTHGRVVRLFRDGLACEFVRLIPIERFDRDIVL